MSINFNQKWHQKTVTKMADTEVSADTETDNFHPHTASFYVTIKL